MKVAIYARVSTTNQAEEGYSIGEQIDKLEKYCDVMNWKVAETYTDAGFTGSNIERPAMQKLISDTKNKRFDTVLVYKLDRLSRSQKDTLYLIEEIFNKNDVGFLSLQEKFDTTTSFGKVMIGILSVFAQLEREQIKERMQLGKLGRAKSGKSMMWAKTAFGYIHNQDTGILEINPLQATIVKQIFIDYLGGFSITKLRDKLNEAGYVGKNRPWSYRTLRQTLDNPVYCGMIKYNNSIFRGLHKEIISKKLYDEVQIELKKRQKQDYEINHNSRPFQAKYMLSGIVKCGYCGAPLKVSLGHIRKDGTRTKKYECVNRFPSKTLGVTVYNNNKKCDSGFYMLEDIEEKVLSVISKIQFDDRLLKAAIAVNEEPQINTSEFTKQLKNINSKIQKLSDLYLNDMISLDELKDKSGILKVDKENLENKLNNATVPSNKNKLKKIKSILGTKPLGDCNYEEQKNMVNQLVKRVTVTEEAVKTDMKTDFIF